MPGEAALDQFIACWKELEDPRTGNAGLHDFHDLLMIALCTVLCGGQGAVDMALFAAAKEPFLRGFLKLKHGVPSHDTFSRLFRFLDPSSSAPRSSGSWRVFPREFRVLWQSTARFCAARSTVPAASRRCIWVGRPGRVILHGKKREHGPDSGDSDPGRPGYVPGTARTAGLLRAIMACNYNLTRYPGLRRRIARNKPGC
jgi:hypothetical protein